MFLDSFLQTEKTYSGELQKLQTNVVNGISGVKEWFTVKEVKGLFWRGSMADRFISAQFRPLVSAVFVVSYADIYVSEIPKNGRIIIKDLDGSDVNYSIIIADDIAGQNDVIVIQLTEYKS